LSETPERHPESIKEVLFMDSEARRMASELIKRFKPSATAQLKSV